MDVDVGAAILGLRKPPHFNSSAIDLVELPSFLFCDLKRLVSWCLLVQEIHAQHEDRTRTCYVKQLSSFSEWRSCHEVRAITWVRGKHSKVESPDRPVCSTSVDGEYDTLLVVEVCNVPQNLEAALPHPKEGMSPAIFMQFNISIAARILVVLLVVHEEADESVPSESEHIPAVLINAPHHGTQYLIDALCKARCTFGRAVLRHQLLPKSGESRQVQDEDGRLKVVVLRERTYGGLGRLGLVPNNNCVGHANDVRQVPEGRIGHNAKILLVVRFVIPADEYEVLHRRAGTLDCTHGLVPVIYRDVLAQVKIWRWGRIAAASRCGQIPYARVVGHNIRFFGYARGS
mmetsp:Transcript_41861/g.77500  ORF Transcript_41861/g.77500 Transcript_41861/m.77500 type:complete len:345 (-) Transcript_41861:51-1085(-)